MVAGAVVAGAGFEPATHGLSARCDFADVRRHRRRSQRRLAARNDKATVTSTGVCLERSGCTHRARDIRAMTACVAAGVSARTPVDTGGRWRTRTAGLLLVSAKETDLSGRSRAVTAGQVGRLNFNG